MREFRVHYKWQDRVYSSVFNAHQASRAIMIAEVMVMPGARVIAVEVLNG